MKVAQARFFTGGSDTDTDDRLLEETKYRNAWNARIGTSEKDGVGSIEVLYGNRLVAYNLPAGTNKIVGVGENERLNAIVYLVYNSNQNHSILEFSRTTETITPILAPQTLPVVVDTKFLNFKDDINYRAYNVKIISKNGREDIMFWTDGYDEVINRPYDPFLIGNPNPLLRGFNPPRNLNITLAKNFMTQAALPRYDNLLGAVNPSVQNEYTDFALTPPDFSPDIVFADDTTVNTNFFRGKPLPQIRYRYIYYDGGQSVWSPISKAGLPIGDENIEGLSFENSFLNNRLDITINTGSPIVVQIQLAVRFGNVGDWRIFDTIDKYTDIQTFPTSLDPQYPPFTDVVYQYYNDRVQQPTSQVDIALPFSYVPIIARNQEIISSNIMTYGDITEGYNPVILDVGLQTNRITQNIVPNPINPLIIRVVLNGTVFQLITQFNNYLQIPVGTVLRFNGSYRSGLSTIPLPQVTHVTKIADYTSQADFVLAIFNTITANPTWLFAGSIFITNTPGGTVINFGQVIVNFGNVTLTTVPPIQKVKSLKNGAWHKFGIVYYDDKLRSTAVNTAPNTRIYVPLQPELVQDGTFPIGTDYSPVYANRLRLTINHFAPEWAKSYQIVYGGTNIDFYVQTPIEAIAINGSGKTEININPLLDYFVTENAPTPVNYVWQQGDRVRFITTSEATGTNILSRYLDVEIKSLSTSAPFLLTTENIDFATLDIGPGSLIEIYRIKEEGDTEIYNEIGECYDVVYDQFSNTYLHSGNIQNQSNLFIPVPAIVELDFGNTYLKPRKYEVTGISDWILPLESDPYSDFYPSSDYDYGRANANIRNIFQQRYEANIRFGGQFFENSGFSGISNFREDEFVSLSILYGRITGLREIGYTLKVVQEQKLSSIYVGRTELFNSDGTSNLAASNTVLGTLNPSEDDYGTRFPGSVVVDDRHLYFFDSSHGVYIRDSANGMTPISGYGKTKEFRDLGVILENNIGKIEIVSLFNKELNTLITTFRNLDPEFVFEDITYSFFDMQGRNMWVGNHNFIPEMYGKRGLTFVMFKDGQLWIMDEQAPYANYFGVQYDFSIDTVFNMEPMAKKVFDAIKVDSNVKMRCTDDLGQEYYITIPADQQYPNGMKSRLNLNKFKPKEGFWWADFLRDANTPTAQGTEEQMLINGRALRGSVLRVRLEVTPTEYVKVFSVVVYSTISKLST